MVYVEEVDGAILPSGTRGGGKEVGRGTGLAAKDATFSATEVMNFIPASFVLVVISRTSLPMLAAEITKRGSLSGSSRALWIASARLFAALMPLVIAVCVSRRALE